MLKKQFLNLNGCQSILLQALANCVQIDHARGDHWMADANLVCLSVCYYLRRMGSHGYSSLCLLPEVRRGATGYSIRRICLSVCDSEPPQPPHLDAIALRLQLGYRLQTTIVPDFDIKASLSNKSKQKLRSVRTSYSRYR